MAEPKIINQQEINRAIAQQQAAQRQLAAAEAAKQSFIEQQKPIITKSISELSSQIKGFTESLKSGKSLKNPKLAVREAMTAGKDIRTGYYSGLEPLETAVTDAQNVLAGITVPAAVYQTTDTSETRSAYDLLFEQFSQYGLGALIEPLKVLIEEGISPAELTLRLRNTDAYKKRFAANQSRIARGLRALSEAEYIGLEDQYQDVMRRYGLPQSYYARGDMGRQEGFEKFISGDVSPVELEDRIQTAQNRITNAPTQIKDALSQFYGAELGNGDILAFVLDPDKALPEIKRKVTAAEIGGAATMAGLGATRTRAEELGRFGVTGEAARQGFQTIAEFLPTAQKLGDIYAKQGMGPFTQTTAEEEVFGITGAAEAGRKRRKLAELETAAFSGQAGAAGGALARERAGSF